MKLKKILPLFLILAAAVGTATGTLAIDRFPIDLSSFTEKLGISHERTDVDLARFPDYTGESVILINNNIPELDKKDGSKDFQIYMDLDLLGRCTEAYANVSKKTMPNEPRGSIGMIRPSGWHLVKYSGIDGNYLYNRCHLIGYQLTGENANENNLITGTRFLNVEAMLPFENKIADYINETKNHVLYKVIPIFEGDNMVAKGVWMQAVSVEDDALSFNVFCYNIQPGIEIDYKTGESRLSSVKSPE